VRVGPRRQIAASCRRDCCGAVGLATIEAGTARAGAAFAGDVAGRLVPAELSARAFYDPAGARMGTS